ncbi:MAG: undecaprenyldiphospho-muramoylpentapeptide beta-N-acetylglucosaminyltransferase [Verrucomicrobiota bacterium]
MTPETAPNIAIACGGTGGHLFPGLAVAEQLLRRGARVTLLISPKEVDQQAVKNLTGMEIVTLPAVGLSSGKKIAFLRGFIRSYRASRQLFKTNRPHAALAMGGFTSAPPILAAKQLGARTFLHESNTIPGRANRWLSRLIHQAFIGFPQAAERLHTRSITVTGTPVRPDFQPADAAACRTALGLDPQRPVLLVVGGSQGATGVNNAVINALPQFPAGLQFLHFTGPQDEERVRRAYAERSLPAVVHAFFHQMPLALGAATLAISRAGASSLAEMAAMRVPSVLIPFPAATDDHQYYNARAFEETGAAHLVSAKGLPPEAAQEITLQTLKEFVVRLVENQSVREQMQAALARWHAPKAAEAIAENMLQAVVRELGCPVNGAGGSAAATKANQSARLVCETTA